MAVLPDDLQLVPGIEEEIEQLGVEMALAMLAHDRERMVDRERGLVDAFTGQGVERVSDGDDPAFQRNVLADESSRVAGPIVSLMILARFC